MIQKMSVYLPMDRRQALARGDVLPERTTGAALFADISGFTSLTEAMVRFFGKRRGAEELPRQLNRVYDSLIGQVHRYGGSVIGFAGDGITCWFDEADGEASVRATACAFALQEAMAAFATLSLPSAGGITPASLASIPVKLALKVAVASGAACRFLVGNRDIQLLEVIAGQTVARMTTGEHLANKGEVVVDAPTVAQLPQVNV